MLVNNDIYITILFINLAGTPHRISYGGMSLVTIAPLAITACLPMVHGHKIVLFAPTQTHSSIIISNQTEGILIILS